MRPLILLLLLFGLSACREEAKWSSERKNKEIAIMVKEFKSEFKTIKADPNIADAKVLHDKKKHGLIIKIKLSWIFNVDKSLKATIKKSIEEETIKEMKNGSMVERYALKRLLKKGIYLQYKYYFPDGSLLTAFNLKQEHL